MQLSQPQERRNLYPLVGRWACTATPKAAGSALPRLSSTCGQAQAQEQGGDLSGRWLALGLCFPVAVVWGGLVLTHMLRVLLAQLCLQLRDLVCSMHAMCG